jgi:hypothetical protein
MSPPGGTRSRASRLSLDIGLGSSDPRKAGLEISIGAANAPLKWTAAEPPFCLSTFRAEQPGSSLKIAPVHHIEDLHRLRRPAQE